MSITIKDVAREANVSVATVSRALNGHENVAPDVRQRVLEVADRLQYSPHHAARSLSSRRTQTIGVVLPDLYGEFFSELMRGIDAVAREAGRHLLVSSYHGNPDEQGAALCLALLDIDHFKRFNDTWGHQTGDQVLRYVSTVLARTCGERRFAARFGGEEFAIIFPGETTAMVMAALEGIRQEVGSRSLRRRSTNEELGAVTISSGFAERLPGETAAALLERADAALYASKRAGRDRVTGAHALDQAA